MYPEAQPRRTVNPKKQKTRFWLWFGSSRFTRAQNKISLKPQNQREKNGQLAVANFFRFLFFLSYFIFCQTRIDKSASHRGSAAQIFFNDPQNLRIFSKIFKNIVKILRHECCANYAFWSQNWQKMAKFLKKNCHKWVEKQCFDVLEACVRPGEIFFTL